MFMIQLGCTKPPLVALHCQQHCVQHTIFCHTSKSILDTQRFRRLLCIQPCVWEETLEKVFRTKQPTLHAISALFPLSHVVLKVVAFLGVRHFDWGHLHVNAPSDPDGRIGVRHPLWISTHAFGVIIALQKNNSKLSTSAGLQVRRIVCSDRFHFCFI